MAALSIDFKRKVADLYLKNRTKLEKLDPTAMESFATEILEIISKEKKKSDALHDLEILEDNMGLLKNYSCPQAIRTRNRRIRLYPKRLQKPDKLHKKMADAGRANLNKPPSITGIVGD